MTASHRRPSSEVRLPSAVADELLQLREEVRVGAPAVEEGDRVAARKGVAYHVRADEAGAAQNQDRERGGWGLGCGVRVVAGEAQPDSPGSRSGRLEELASVLQVCHPGPLLNAVGLRGGSRKHCEQRYLTGFLP